MFRISGRFLWFVIPIVFLITLLVSVTILFNRTTKNSMFTSLQSVPYRPVGLLLGTSRLTSNGMLNPFYYARLKAAADLYVAGKIKYILASGDNQFISYNEPQTMKKTLLVLGVAESDIFLDFAGFRTLDSVMRARTVFGVEQFTIITQRPHSMRALYLALHFKNDAISYVADLPHDYRKILFYFRESLARVKAVLDIYVLHTQPRYIDETHRLLL